MRHIKTVSIIVPCYNEAAVIDRFYAETKAVLETMPQYNFEIIFVNDGSRDDTLRHIGHLAKVDRDVKYISFSRNFGKESAMLAGLEHATGDIVGIMDADLQHSPSMIPQMLSAVDNEGYDVAAARRSDREGEEALKSRLSEAFYKIVNKVSDTYIDDGAQDFRFMKRQVVDSIISMQEHNRFIKGIFSFVGFNTKWFPHENIERAAGETKWNIKKLFRYAIDGIIGFTNFPLRLPLFLGLLFAAAGVLGYIITLILCLATDAAWGSRLIVDTIFFVGGVIMCCIGVTGEYIARIYDEVKDRPKYIIQYSNCVKKK